MKQDNSTFSFYSLSFHYKAVEPRPCRKLYNLIDLFSLNTVLQNIIYKCWGVVEIAEGTANLIGLLPFSCLDTIQADFYSCSCSAQSEVVKNRDVSQWLTKTLSRLTLCLKHKLLRQSTEAFYQLLVFDLVPCLSQFYTIHHCPRLHSQ